MSNSTEDTYDSNLFEEATQLRARVKHLESALKACEAAHNANAKIATEREEEIAALWQFLNRNEEQRASIAGDLADAHAVLDEFGIAQDDGIVMLTAAARVRALASQSAKLRAACEAAQVFVHCNSLLCEYGNHADLCKQLRAALEGK